jgi:hypothetical protein
MGRACSRVVFSVLEGKPEEKNLYGRPRWGRRSILKWLLEK